MEITSSFSRNGKGTDKDKPAKQNTSGKATIMTKGGNGGSNGNLSLKNLRSG